MGDLMVKTSAGLQSTAARYEEVDTDSEGQRLDNFLLRTLKGVPRSHIYKLIRSGQVRVNSGRVRARYRLKEGDQVRVPPIIRNTSLPVDVSTSGIQWLAEHVLYEDSRILVLNKPAGMAVHGGSGISFGCIEALRSLKPSLRKADLVHRLDRATSGCLLVAKRRSALRQIHTLLRDRNTVKRYLALLKGHWQHGEVEIDLPVTVKRRGGGSHVCVDPAGKEALTHFRVIDYFDTQATLVEILIATGRTHQIRVHAAHAGHPVAGDDRYGDDVFNTNLVSFGLRRLFLHAHAIEFVWPESEEVFAVSAPLPKELSVVLDELNRRSRGREDQRRSPEGWLKAK